MTDTQVNTQTAAQAETQKIVNDILVERFEVAREKLVATAVLREDLKFIKEENLHSLNIYVSI